MATVKELWTIALDLLGETELNRRFRLWVTGLIRTASMKKAALSSTAAFTADVATILDDLNSRTSARFTATDKAQHLIRERFKEGYLVQDFLRVHEIKASKWLADPAWKDYLRPTTLYAPAHFDEYLAEWYAQDRLDKEKAARIQANRDRHSQITQATAQATTSERQQLIAELMAKQWWEHDSWADFIRWMSRFPDAQSQAAYPLPAQIDRMRRAPGMLLKVLKGTISPWVEEEYAALKAAARKKATTPPPHHLTTPPDSCNSCNSWTTPSSPSVDKPKDSPHD